MTSAAPSNVFVVAAVCLRDEAGRILTVRKQGTEAFMLPGGKLEPGESAREAALREVAEEVGLVLDDVDLLGHWVEDAANEPGHLVDATVFTGPSVTAADLAPVASAEIAELRWFDPAEPDTAFAAPLAPLLTTVLPALSPVTVVGIGADGWAGVPPAHRERITAADVVLGGRRHLDLLPEQPGQERLGWPRDFDLAALLADLRGRRVVALASGDPLRSGVGTTLVRALGGAGVEVLPAVSSVSLARARMRWSAEETTVVTVVGRRVERVLRELAPGHRLLVLSADETTPGDLAARLVQAGWGETTMTVLGDLGAASESRRHATAATWSGQAPRLHVLALECRGAGPASWAGGLPDDAYEHDGQLTKRDLRAGALARLAPAPHQLLWDVGAGAGSVGIEWMRSHPTCRTVAVEADPARAARVARNAARLGVPDVHVVEGHAPDALADLPAPDAVFVGGGATAEGLLEVCQARLRPGGRLVVHGVTLETEQRLAEAYTEHGGELTRHAVEHAAPIGAFTGWTPARAVTQWAWTKPVEGPVEGSAS